MRRYGFMTFAAALTLLAPPVGGAAPRTYTDPSGDNGAAADIGAVTVDIAADGFIVIKPTIANMPALGQPGFVAVAFDTDRNGATGALLGGDYVVVFALSDATFGMLRWSGSEYVDATGDMRALIGAGTVEFHVRPAAIGGATAFNFAVVASTGDSAQETDIAPDAGTWFFEPARPVVVTADTVDAKFVPAVPRAGQTFAAPIVRIRLSNGRTILAQKYRCVAQLGGRLLRGSGKGGCTFAIPKNAKGKRLRVTLFVTYKGVTDEYKPYVFKVR